VFRDFFSDGRYEQIGMEDAVRYGALVIVLKTLFWKRCKISMLE